jgi:gliding motility-associated-like protein
MMKFLRFSFLYLATLSAICLEAQPGCPNVNAGTDISLPCGTNCTNLTATPFPSGNTTSYGVGAIPYTPFSYTAGTPVIVNDDDIWTSPINLPFTFCFFGNSYNQLVIGANGLISFDLTNAGTYCTWDITAASPIPSTSVYTNAIFGPYHDIDPSQGGTIKYQIIGTFPCRIFVVSYYDIPMYDDIFLIGSCWGTDHATHQIVLYETTNAIEIYTQRKESCSGWNDGLAIEGIQNATGTVGFAVPGRNLTVYNSTNSAYRFTPNGASIVSVDWLEGATVIGTGNTVNVCPSNSSTTYTARATYIPCSGGTPVVVTDNVVVTLPGTLNSNISASTNVSCNGGNNGTATATVSGGNAPITYGWSTGSSALSISGLSAGTYVFTANDAANCVRRDTVIITQPPALSLNVPNVSFNNCSGTGTGSLSAIPSGGTPGYTYAWSSTAQTDSVLDNVSAGSYTVTMTDANGCTATQSGTITITNSPIVFGTPTLTGATCSTGGSIVTNVSGGVGALTYAWSTGAVTSGLTNVPAGTYDLTVTDQSSCSATVSYTVPSGVGAVILQAPTIINVQCNAGNNGSITVNATGGTGTLTYTWAGGQTSPSITGLTAGTYSITVSDPTGCSATTTYTITEPLAIVVAAPVITDATCSTGGSIATNVTGGSGTFTYLWSNGQTTATAANLASGSYTVTYTDQTSLCTATGSYNVGLIGVLPNIFVATPAPITCTTTSQTLTATSVTPGATFTWSTGATTANVTATTGGTYTVTALDPNNGCTASSSVVVSMDTITPLVLIPDPDTLTCLVTTSTVGAATSAPTPTFIWSDGNTNQSFTVIAPGPFSVTVTNTVNGCTASASTAVIQDITAPSLTVSNNGNLDCTHLTIDVTATTNVSNATYVWSSGGTAAVNTVSTPGPYSVTVTNPSNGCTSTGSNTVTQDITVPTLTIAPATLLTCLQPSQTLASTTSAVTPSYNWSDGTAAANNTVSSGGLYSLTVTDLTNGCSASASENVAEDKVAPSVNLTTPAQLTCIVTSADITVSTSAVNASYLWNTGEVTTLISTTSPGQYTVTVTNTDNGCTASNVSTVTQDIITPSISISTPPLLGCAITSVNLTATSNAVNPFYNWSTGASGITLNVTTSGSYTVTVTNQQNGCTASASQLVGDAPPLVVDETVVQPLCNTFPNSGSIVLNVTSGSPQYTYTWSTGSSQVGLNNLTEGTYSATVVDQQGCTVVKTYTLIYQYNFSIDATSMPTINMGESVDLGYTITGTAGTLTNVWSPNINLSSTTTDIVTASPLSTIRYRIDVTNQVGCLAYDTVTVVVIPDYQYYVPNAFSPNQDGVNDEYEIFGKKKNWKFLDMQIFNRWGERVFTSSDINFHWDGRFKGQLLTPQVLVYTLQITFIDGHSEMMQRGSITLLR